MKNVKKALLSCLCIAALISATVMGTIAWLTDKETVVNTVTVGQVDIVVDEADVELDGTPIVGADRVTENQYHLIPGQSYTKDPTMTVDKNSEAAYVRILLTLTCKSQLEAAFNPTTNLMEIFEGYDPAVWVLENETADATTNSVTYEFRYPTLVDPDGADVELAPLFESFTIPGTLSGTDMKSLENLTITVTGHAIQASGFADADQAWAAFDTQNP